MRDGATEPSRLRPELVDWRELIKESTSDVLFQNDLAGRVLWISDAVEDALGYKPEAVVGRDVLSLVHPSEVERIRNARARAWAGEELDSIPLRVRHANGEYRNLQARTRPLYGSDGAIIGNVVVWKDIHDRLAAVRAFATLTEANRVLLRAADSDSLLQDMCETITSVGEYALAIYGVLVHDAEKSVHLVAVAGEDHGYAETLKLTWGEGPLGQGPTGICLRTGKTQVRNELSQDPRFAPWLAQASSRGIQCSIALPVFVHDTIHGALMVYSQEAGSFDARAQGLLEGLAADLGFGLSRYEDVAALEVSEAARDHAVQFDWLTGLAKKPLSAQRIADVLATRRVPGWALLCVGVDGMTAINQAFTYQAGDAVLREVAARLVDSAGAHDRVGRIAGDEFVVILRDVITATDAAEAAQRLIEDIHGSVQFEDEIIDVSACVGIAMFEQQDADGLIRDATVAMRAASRRGFGTYAFVDENTAISSRIALDTQMQLREAVTRGEITSWYMPVMRLEDGKPCGYEALVRWIKEDGSLVMPDQFLAIAERSHLIIDIDRLVLSQAVDALLCIDPSLHIAVNVSAPTLQAGQLTATVLAEIARSGIDPRRLHLEVTETALLNVSESVKQVMRDLAHIGITWWLDDFGTGYSSISHLRDLPIHGVKLDQTFTAGLVAGDSHAARLTRGLAGLADGLNLRTVAEGVETAEQAALLRGQGWEMAQGWHFGKPAPLPT